nr:hypothetical protein [uncultured Flavobacterium sp.]
MNEHLTGEITTDGKNILVDLRLKTKTNDYSCVEYAIVKVMNYYGIIVRYENKDMAEDNETISNITSTLKFEIKNGNYPTDWADENGVSVRIMTINDDGTDMEYLKPYFDERLAYYKHTPGISHDDLIKYTKDWEDRQKPKSAYIQKIQLKNRLPKPRIIKGDIVLGFIVP